MSLTLITEIHAWEVERDLRHGEPNRIWAALEQAANVARRNTAFDHVA